MKKYIFLIILTPLMHQINSQQLNPGYSMELIAEGLNPVAMTTDHHGRIWLAEKDGRVLIIDENDQLQDEPVVTLDVDEFNERGLLGIALHPEHDEHPYLYLYFTVENENHNRVSRFTLSGDFVVPGSEKVLLELDQLSGAIHNGGALLFDQHNHLFIATGEAGLSSNSQDTTNLLGKILRLHDDGSIPTENPFYGRFEGKNQAIYSLGFRNPFNLSYDWSGDQIFATDVGAGDYEEINVVQHGKNFGWPLVEGPIGSNSPPQDYQDPYFYYEHSDGCAIVGLHLVKDTAGIIGSDLDSAIFFADYCNGYIKYLQNGNPDSVRTFATELERPLNIIYNSSRSQLYFLTRAGLGGGSSQDNTSTLDGRVWKILFTGNGIPNIVVHPQDLTLGKEEQITFEVRAVGNDTMMYQWYINDSLHQDSESEIFVILNSSSYIGLNEIFVIVTNSEGSDTSHIAAFEVLDKKRPTAVISSPASDFQYKAGDTIHFKGKVIDENGFELEQHRLSWKIDFHHDLHTHPFIERIDSIREGIFVVPVRGEPDTNVWMRIHLTGIDQDGLSTAAIKDIYPEIGVLHIATNFSGKLNIDGAIRSLPYDLYSVIGLERRLEVPQRQMINDHIFLFSQWGNGSTNRFRNIVVQDLLPDTTYVLFDTIRQGDGIGLYAEYFNDPEFDLDGSPDFVRIDSLIDFHWGGNSPVDGIIDNDAFTVRWRGFLKPLFDEEYTFLITSDDGMRMWLNDQLFFDEWYNHPPLEFSNTIFLEANEKYRIQIEYFDKGGGAQMEFSWKSDHTSREYVPKRQLYPMEFGSLHARIWLDENLNDKIDVNEQYLANETFILFDEQNNLIDLALSNDDGFFAFRNYEIGRYKILMVPSLEMNDKSFGFQLNESGYSEFFKFSADSLIETRFSLRQKIASKTTDSDQNLALYLYPNPTFDRLIVHHGELNIKKWFFVTSAGKKMNVQATQVSNEEMRFDLEKILPGHYFLCLIDHYGHIYSGSIMKI